MFCVCLSGSSTPLRLRSESFDPQHMVKIKQYTENVVYHERASVEDASRMVAQAGVEPATPRSSGECSTTELPGHVCAGLYQSKRRARRVDFCLLLVTLRLLRAVWGLPRTGAERLVRGCSSADRALHSHCRGQGFKSPQLHHLLSDLNKSLSDTLASLSDVFKVF